MSSANLVARLHHKLQKEFSTPRALSRIAAHENAIVRSLGTAFRAHREGRLDPVEMAALEKIERLRRELCSSTETLEVPDYGAGSPTSSAESMAGGNVATATLGEACRNFSKPPEWATLLYHLVRSLKPVNCVELGTCLGISAAYQATALAHNGSGQLTTLEGAPPFAAIAAKNLENLGLASRASVVVGRFQDTLPAVLASHKVDYAFIDGHHDETATIRYFDQFLPHLAASALLVFDDIDWSPGMMRAWQHLQNHPSVDVCFDLGGLGVCAIGAGTRERGRLVVV